MENHFSEMNGDVGISSHEKVETRTCLHVAMSSIYKEQNNALSDCNKDGDWVIDDFLSWYTHVLVSLLFHEVTFLHPPSFDFSYVSFVATSYNCAYVTINENFFLPFATFFLRFCVEERGGERPLYP